MDDPDLRREMGAEARRQCYLKCWDRIFVEVYKAYELCKLPDPPRRLAPLTPGRLLAEAPGN
jgi:hypothetical protein